MHLHKYSFHCQNAQQIRKVLWLSRVRERSHYSNTKTVTPLFSFPLLLPNAGQFYFNSYHLSDRVWGESKNWRNEFQSPCDIFSYLGKYPIIMKLQLLTQKGKQTNTKHFHDTAILLKCSKQIRSFLETTLLPWASLSRPLYCAEQRLF